MRAKPLLVVAALLATAPLFGACADFDMDKLDVFNLNREEKLKGERKPLFPEGVPGVSQGIPPDLVKGAKPAETAAVPVEAPPPETPKPKAQPKPRVVKRTPPKPAPAPTRVQVSPAAPAQQQQVQQQPAPQPQQQQQSGTQSPWPSAPQTQTSPWPDAPPPNTFQR
jgi:hypothetical protein